MKSLVDMVSVHEQERSRSIATSSQSCSDCADTGRGAAPHGIHETRAKRSSSKGKRTLEQT
eukprot:3374384-Pleurochrysis_carterae.AAC.2